MRIFSTFLLFFVCIFSAAHAETSADNAYPFTFKDIDGKDVSLGKYSGKVLLVVNTASQCGFSSQLSGLQKLYDTYKDKGLVVIGVPSNDFGGQEPNDAKGIKDYAAKEHHVTFPLMAKTEVSGEKAHPFYQWAGGKAGLLGKPLWNFHKYLIGKNGEFITWFSSTTAPEDGDLKEAIEKALDAQ
ncbi:MAG: glutathione peroxidase [Proteobacteria bacterium]|nr:glutathione peroxidase [Pseudomonadota bacterium]